MPCGQAPSPRELSAKQTEGVNYVRNCGSKAVCAIKTRGKYIMEKRPFLTEEQAQEIIQDVPTPFHVYDEKGIRENARRINKAPSSCRS